MTRTGKDSNKAKKSLGRSQRLAVELRENLRRRKVQERGRAAPSATDGSIKPGLTARDGRVR
jgi:hypothetical protein